MEAPRWDFPAPPPTSPTLARPGVKEKQNLALDAPRPSRATHQKLKKAKSKRQIGRGTPLSPRDTRERHQEFRDLEAEKQEEPESARRSAGHSLRPRPGTPEQRGAHRAEAARRGLPGPPPPPPPHLVESKELLLELLALRVGTLPPEPKLHHLVPAAATAAGCARPRRS